MRIIASFLINIGNFVIDSVVKTGLIMKKTFVKLRNWFAYINHSFDHKINSLDKQFKSWKKKQNIKVKPLTKKQRTAYVIKVQKKARKKYVLFQKFLKKSLKIAKKKTASLKLPKINLDFLMKVKKSLTKLLKSKKTSVKSVKKKPEKKKIKKTSTFKSFVYGILFTLFFVIFPFNVYEWFRQIPSPDLLVDQSGGKPTRILDRNGRLLYEIYVDKRFDPVTLSEIPEHVVQATIAVEDAKFYDHFGLDFQGIGRALVSNAKGDAVQGGSTITQQLIKNVLLTSERTITRKAREAFLAVLVEAKYSKKEILELYLNNISYGGTAWGIESASQKYFDKHVWELSLAESSLLAGLPSAPSRYSPLSGDLASAKSRQKHVLSRMIGEGFITSEEAEEAYDQELSFNKQGEFIRAPHFVAYVRDELENRFGKRMVEFGGLTVTTTLDLDVHDEVQKMVVEQVEASSYLNISNAAAVVLDPKSSEIIAHVGSVDYFKDSWGAYDVATAYRQPGSSLKPIAYALALTNNYTPATIIKDTPVTYQIPGSSAYTPKNYDGRFHGDVTLRTALSNSYNIPAVRLSHQYGPDAIVELGRDMGLLNWELDSGYGLSVVLGGKEVRLLDSTNVYSTFARGGHYLETTPFLSIKDSFGYELYDYDARKTHRALSEEVAYQIYHILSDNNARLPSFGYSSSLIVPGHKVAVKTGTTDEKRDNWTLGFTPSYTVGVWVGNNDNTPMHPSLSSGLSGASPIWDRIMTFLLEDSEGEVMQKPDGVFVMYDEKCGLSEVFRKGSKVPKHLCKIDEEKDDKDKDDE